MKNFLKLIFLFPLFVIMSCSDDIMESFNDDSANYEYVKEITVPIGTSKVFIEYNSKTIEIPVKPEIIVPKDGKDIEPWGKVTLSLTSSVKTVFNAYYEINNRRVELIENGIINKKVTQTKVENGYKLSEPKKYKNSDLGFTTYHSSGVVMFEDSWPTSSRTKSGVYDTDFNDLVIDYDLETVVVPEELLASEGWREQVKVVLHVRAISGNKPARVGVILEDFNIDNVETIDGYCSFDSWQNPHGVLPNWTKKTLQENSLHYESNKMRPCVEIGAIFRINETTSGSGTEEYERVNDNGSTFKTVMNPKINSYWEKPKTEQYSSDLESLYVSPQSLKSVQKLTYYNVIPGFVNVSGGLYTYTVIYHMKPRNKMSSEEKSLVLENMINTVYETTNQNFYLINKDFTPVGLKGYIPGDFKVKGYNSYADKYNQVFAANSNILDENIPYVSKDGLIWEFKCPTLTRHLWNKLNFSSAYPKYMSWMDSNGEENTDWYENGVDSRYLTCWW